MRVLQSKVVPDGQKAFISESGIEMSYCWISDVQLKPQKVIYWHLLSADKLLTGKVCYSLGAVDLHKTVLTSFDSKQHNIFVFYAY